MSTYLLLDANYLCWRSFHSMGELSYGAIKTGVVFGLLKSVTELQDQFGADKVVFCFDHGVPKRRELLAGYKLKRHTKRDNADRDSEEAIARRHMVQQVDALREEYLPRIGYRNVLFQQGYEADDMIAMAVENWVEDKDEAIIVSADRDLLQLLQSNVLMYNPQQHKMTTLVSFHKRYGIAPWEYAKVKAIAGCSTDEIPGVKGVGEKTAIKYLRSELKYSTKACQAIDKQWKRVVLRNRDLVKLPMAGTRLVPQCADAISQDGWDKVCEELGMKSLRGSCPVGVRQRRGFGLDRHPHTGIQQD